MTGRPDAPIDFDALHESTQLLVIAGAYEDVLPAAWRGYIDAAGEYAYYVRTQP